MVLNNWTTRLVTVITLFACFSCQPAGNRLNVDTTNVDIEPVNIFRYEQKLFDIKSSDLISGLQKIQADYGVFLNGDLSDSLNLQPLLNYIEDTVLQNVNRDCQQVFPDLDKLEGKFTEALRHHKYYFPEAELPAIYTYISGFDYEHPAQIMDNNLLIALDMYLGEDYFRYKQLGLPAYMLHRFDEEYIVRDCMKELAKTTINYRNIGAALLDLMVNEGKIIWYTNAMMPAVNDTVLLNYTAYQMEWASNSEGAIWAFLLENEMLYTKDNESIKKFIYESPFTSYFGAESPPRLGWFIGWKIVSAYMQNNPDVELHALMNEYDAQKILKLSGYKPGI